MKPGDRVAIIFEIDGKRAIFFGRIAEYQSGHPNVLSNGRRSAVPVRLDCNPSEIDWVNTDCVKPCPTIVEEIGFYGRGDVRVVRSEE